MAETSREDKIHKTAKQRQVGAVVLEDIHDPHNAAAVWRSCEAFGIQDVYLIFKQEQRFNPRKIGKATSSSANKWLNFHVFSTPESCMTALRERGYTTYATALDVNAEPLFTANLTQEKIAWLFGNEHRGLSPEIMALCDRRIYIPMSGLVQSLNVSVTAGICLFEMTRQRQVAGFEKFLLTSSEQDTLVKNWTS